MTNVAVIDDDFGPAKFSELPLPLQEAFQDQNSEVSRAALSLIDSLLNDGLSQNILGTINRHKEEDNLPEFLQSDEFTTEIFLPFHERILSGELGRSYKDSNFSAAREYAKKLKSIFNEAFGEANVKYFPDRNVSIDEIKSFDFLVLDLFIKTPEDVIQDITVFLKHLVQHCENHTPPPILLMSSHAELKLNLGKIRSIAEISAAGMIALSKREIINDAGTDGLILMCEQLHYQRQAARKTKVLISAWSSALESARARALETIWSLDASAMQQFHYTAYSENDPFDEHLSDLLSREYQWHVENNVHFQEALSELDKTLLNDINQESMEITHRYPQHHPHDEIKALSLIQAHYNWSGTPQSTDLISITKDQLQENFNRILPFGTVLTEKDAAATSKAWIHITQQCDLNKREIYQNSSSVLFLEAELIDASAPTEKKDNELILTGFPLPDTNLSLKVTPSRFLAVPIDFLHGIVTSKKLCTVGRLRIDIAKMCLQAFLNHSSRPAAFSIANKSPESVRAFLVAPGESQNRDRHIKYENPADPEKAKIIEVIRIGKKFLFSDHDCNGLALWLIKHAPAQDDGIRSRLAAQLRQGIADTEGSLEHIPYAVHKAQNFERCLAGINGIQISPTEFKLVFFSK